MHFPTTLSLCVLGASSLVSAYNPAEIFRRADAKRPTIEKRVPNQPFKNARLQERAYGSYFSTPKTEKFVVNGTAIPDVDFDIGESYAGLLPISGAANETRELCVLSRSQAGGTQLLCRS